MHQLERNNRAHLMQLDLHPDQTQTQYNTSGIHHDVIISKQRCSIKKIEAQSRNLGASMSLISLFSATTLSLRSFFSSTALSPRCIHEPLSSQRQPCSKFFLLYSSTRLLAAAKARNDGGPGLERRQQQWPQAQRVALVLKQCGGGGLKPDE
jgi:hypothetical protein